MSRPHGCCLLLPLILLGTSAQSKPQNASRPIAAPVPLVVTFDEGAFSIHATVNRADDAISRREGAIDVGSRVHLDPALLRPHLLSRESIDAPRR